MDDDCFCTLNIALIYNYFNGKSSYFLKSEKENNTIYSGFFYKLYFFAILYKLSPLLTVWVKYLTSLYPSPKQLLPEEILLLKVLLITLKKTK